MTKNLAILFLEKEIKENEKRKKELIHRQEIDSQHIRINQGQIGIADENIKEIEKAIEILKKEG